MPPAIASSVSWVSKKFPYYAPDKLGLITQQQLSSLQSAVNAATQNGIRYNQIMRIGGWELKFGLPSSAGKLPALFHAQPIK